MSDITAPHYSCPRCGKRRWYQIWARGPWACAQCGYLASMIRPAGATIAIAALLGIVACTAPPVAVDATERGPAPWVDSSARELCVPVDAPQARAYVEPGDGCGQDLEWPCERGAACLAGDPAACACKCDVGRDDDCAGAWFAHWYPGAIAAATCDAGVCVLRRAR